MAANKTLADVFSRARSLLNDELIAGGRVFTDTLLLPHALSAYDWFVLHLSEHVPVDVRKRVTDMTYTANEGTLSDLAGWPTDMWLPEVISFRKNTSEEYQDLSRVDDLSSPVSTGTSVTRLSSWAFTNRQVTTIPSSAAGLIRLDYLAILADLTGAASPILMDVAVSAMAYYAAADAAGKRGQDKTQIRLMGAKETGGHLGRGADGFMEKVIQIHVKNEQFTDRRGFPQHGTGANSRDNYEFQ